MSDQQPIKPTYLGDGVYAEFDGFHIKLYTSNGIDNSEPIYLELMVFESLHRYAKQIWELEP